VDAWGSKLEYEFLLVVDGVSMDDDGAVAIITDTFDGLLSSNRGLHRLAVAGEGANAADALQNLLRQFAADLPALRILRQDPDLVGVSDIAERTGHSRQNVQQWVTGERNAERPFPAPEGTAGRSFVWRWADINEWLKPLGLDDQAERPTREESILLDFALLEWNNALESGLQSGREEHAASETADTDPLPWATHGSEASSQRTALIHRNMLARIPAVTGQSLREWFMRLEAVPVFLRTEERAHWLSDEHGLTHGYALAIVQEYELQRRIRRTSEDTRPAENEGSRAPEAG
jgi:predicted DNA-binding transcriptional regulator AlpA